MKDNNILLEKWKPVIGFEDYYEVSNAGNIRRKEVYTLILENNHAESHYRIIPACNLNPGITDQGYVRIHFKGINGEKSKKHHVHRLVAKAFIPNPQNKPYINHKNSIRNDNRVDNLEWVTTSENIKHGFDFGFCEVNNRKQVINTKTGKVYPTMSEISKELKISLSRLSSHLKGTKTSNIYDFIKYA